jgi:adenosine kinase
MRREFGGCAGNIAYNLRLLGGQPVVMATVGEDGEGYLARMQAWGLDLSLVRRVPGTYTAQAMIITDQDNNQITAFHPGAMQHAHETLVPAARADLRIGIIAPDGRDAMVTHAQQMADAGIDFIFDPGQGLPMFDAASLRRFIDAARWIAVNDYEGRMLCERLGTDLAALSRLPGLRGVVVTLGAQGCEIWTNGQCTSVPPVTPQAVVDPTGCGDAFRAALLYGLERGWSLARCADLGNRLGALKVASHGPQNHALDAATALMAGTA